MTEWTALHPIIDGGDPGNVVRLTHNLTAATRKALVEPLRAYEKELRTGTFVSKRHWGPRLCALTVAGAALLPTASSVAVWVTRNGLREDETGTDVIDLVVAVLRDRQVSWLPDLVDRLALRLPPDRLDEDLRRLVTSLASHTGIAPLATDGLVYSWIATGHADTGRSALARRLFEVDGVGPLLEAGGWPAKLANDPALDRTMLLEGCLFRLRRGGRTADLNGFLVLHKALAPTTAEVAMLAEDYEALLSGSYAPVAAMARHQLTLAGQAGAVKPCRPVRATP
ncbi:hypothetical protein [Kibdelosporangium phytohabitans]|uniref:Uncharacterized protein n=1 Tax=Kibdelosporangium phytohabitans TaxID=860235 RepID=A0A0N9I8Y9_9PSEU|nr:hypothetical protein [Kibdelosporangium phytohabitans]ALG12826.1 hypothetical protein AOZ06_43565 [Kibdelosporangium phytohabitans]MBE1464516.1 hypothetical protein [Kibdelosporangium phytohabitans]